MEEPLPAGGSCLLGSINLSSFVKGKKFDEKDFVNTVRVATKALNKVLEEGLPLHPLQEQRDSVTNWRQIGLGVMGIADMLIKMELRYDSDEAIKFCDRIGQLMSDTAIATSSELAKELGTYPKYNELVLDTQYFKNNASKETTELVKKNGLRNSQLLTIAPTGTLSTMLGISGGIEPIFANSYQRKTQSLHGKDVFYKVYTPIVQDYMDAHGLTEEEQLPEWFVTSGTINPFKRIKMQGIWQKHIDASISSTINLPESASVDLVEKLYCEAWKAGLKGVTIYRDNCKRSGVLVSSAPEEKVEPENKLPRGFIFDCSDDLVGKKRKLQTGCGSLHVSAFFDPVTGELQEVYLSKGSTGGCQNFMIGLSRMISLLARAGVDVYSIKDQLDSTGACPSYAVRSATHHDTSKGSCCPMAIGNALIDMYEEMQRSLEDREEDVYEEVEEEINEQELEDNGYCPECGDKLVHEGGCDTCKSCGYSHCG